VLALVERKAQGEHIAVQPAAEEAEEPVPDLMSALKASLDAVRARDGDGDGAEPKKAPAAKKAPAEKTPSKR
jgi:DNA end-binding protein Ku